MFTFVLSLLLAQFVAADSFITVFDFLGWADTVTLKGSDFTATTYFATDCATFVEASSLDACFVALTTPTPEPKAPQKRGLTNENTDDISSCSSYTIIQGPSTYECHDDTATPLTATRDWACSWQGTSTTADITCNKTVRGQIAQTLMNVVFDPSDLAGRDILTVEVVTALTTSANSTTTLAASGPSPTGSATAITKSTGAAVGSLPTGVVALAGAAAGVFAAALAL